MRLVIFTVLCQPSERALHCLPPALSAFSFSGMQHLSGECQISKDPRPCRQSWGSTWESARP